MSQTTFNPCGDTVLFAKVISLPLINCHDRDIIDICLYKTLLRAKYSPYEDEIVLGAHLAAKRLNNDLLIPPPPHVPLTTSERNQLHRAKNLLIDTPLTNHMPPTPSFSELSHKEDDDVTVIVTEEDMLQPILTEEAPTTTLALIETRQLDCTPANSHNEKDSFRVDVERVLSHRYHPKHGISFRIKWRGFDIETNEDFDSAIKAKDRLREYLETVSKRGLTTIKTRYPKQVAEVYRQ